MKPYPIEQCSSERHAADLSVVSMGNARKILFLASDVDQETSDMHTHCEIPQYSGSFVLCHV